MARVGIFYGSTLGDTKSAAELIANEFDNAEVFNVADIDVKQLDGFDLLVLGSSTWGIGDLQDDWFTFIRKLDNYDFNKQKVAIFGFGDQESYPDSFVDAIGVIYENLLKKGAIVLGNVPIDSYEFTDSKAAKNGQFVGLPLDDVNQSDLTDKRIKSWTKDLKKSVS